MRRLDGRSIEECTDDVIKGSNLGYAYSLKMGKRMFEKYRFKNSNEHWFALRRFLGQEKAMLIYHSAHHYFRRIDNNGITAKHYYYHEDY